MFVCWDADNADSLLSDTQQKAIIPFVVSLATDFSWRQVVIYDRWYIPAILFEWDMWRCYIQKDHLRY